MLTILLLEGTVFALRVEELEQYGNFFHPQCFEGDDEELQQLEESHSHNHDISNLNC